MDSLEIFTQLPVDPEAYYLVGLQVYGVPGFDFLSPIGTSGTTIAAAFNPCVGGWTQHWRCSAVLTAASWWQAGSSTHESMQAPLSQTAETLPTAVAMQGTTPLHLRGSRWASRCPPPWALRSIWASS